MESSSRKLLLIDSRVEAENLIIACRDNVDYLTFNFDEYDFVQLQSDIDAKLDELNAKGAVYTDVALVQHGTPSLEYQIVGNSNVSRIDEEAPFESFSDIKDFLINLKAKGVERFDFLACALYSHVNMQNVFAHLETETGVDLRASNNFVGEYPNGDWIQESDNVDIRSNYFTESISNFKEILFYFTFRDSKVENTHYISTGSSSASAILVKSTGKIYTWGTITVGNVADNQNNFGVFKDLSGNEITNFVDVFATRNAIAGLTSEGKIWAVGSLTGGGLGTTSGTLGILKDSNGVELSNFTKVYANNQVFAAIQGTPGAGSKVYTWGNTLYGALSTSSAVIGYTHASLDNTVKIFSNANNFAALKSDGTVWAWGSTLSSGHLGNNAVIPATNTLLNGTTDIISNNQSFAAIVGSGSTSKVYAWGNTTRGHLGATANTPETNVLLDGTTKIFSNTGTFAAIVGSGSTSKVYTWGALNEGHLGSNPNIPETNALLDGINDIVNTYYAYTCIKNVSGVNKVYAWGQADGGIFSAASTAIPATNSVLDGVTKIIGNTNSGFGVFAAIVNKSGVNKVYTWGSIVNDNGNLSTTSSFTPETNSLVDGATDIYPLGTSAYSFVAKVESDLWAWGAYSSVPFKLTTFGKNDNPLMLNAGRNGIIDNTYVYNYTGIPFTTYYIIKTYSLPKERFPTIYARNGVNANSAHVIINNSGLIEAVYPYTGTKYVPVGLENKIISRLWQSGNGAFMAKTQNGEIWTWGTADMGSLGPDPRTAYQLIHNGTPVTDVISVNSTNRSFLARTSAGIAYTWGMTTAGGLGVNASTPAVVTYNGQVLTNITKVNCNSYVFVIVVGTGATSKVYTWGATSGSANLGTGNTQTVYYNPALDGTYDVVIGSSAMAAIKYDGTVWTWGNTLNGHLGANEFIPVTNPLLNGTTKIFTSSGSTFAAIVGSGDNSKVYTWGSKIYGHLGPSENTPVHMTDLDGVNTLYTIGGVFAALKNGTVYCWGKTDSGALVTSNTALQAAVVAGTSITSYITHSLLTDVAEIHSTTNCFVVKKNDGTIVTWGAINQGHFGTATHIPETHPDIVNVTDVYVNNAAVLVRKNDGSYWAWGSTSEGGYFGNKTPYKIPFNINHVYKFAYNSFVRSRNFIMQDANNVTYCLGNNGIDEYINNGQYLRPFPYMIESPTPTITWTANGSTINKVVTDTNFTLLPPVSNSNGAFSYSSTDASVATVNATTGVVDIVGGGSTILSAYQEGTSNYCPAIRSITLNVGKDTPTLSWIPGTAKDISVQSFTIEPPSSSSSGEFIYTSDNTDVAVVYDNIVTLTGGGIVTLKAIQFATTEYIEAETQTSLIVITDPVQSWSPISKLLTDAPFTTTPTTDSDGAITYSSSNVNVATISSEGLVTIVSYGVVTLSAEQAATPTKNAKTITTVLTVNKLTPFFSWVSALSKLTTDGSFQLPAHSTTSPGTVSYSSSNTGVATVSSSGFVTFVSGGTTTINLNITSTDTIKEVNAPLELTYNRVYHTTNGIQIVNGSYVSPQSLEIGSSRSLLLEHSGTPTYTIDNADVISINGLNMNGIGLGTAVITYSLPETNIYNATTFYQQITVVRKVNTLSSSNQTVYVGGDLTIANSGNSNGAISYSSSNTSKATVDSAGVVTLLAAGSVTITVSQAETSLYEAKSVNVVLTIKAAISTSSSLLSQISNGDFTNAFDNYKKNSGKSVGKIYTDLMNSVKSYNNTDYNNAVSAINAYILNNSDIPIQNGNKVLSFTTVEEINEIKDAMFDTLDTLPDKSIKVIFPMGVTPTVNAPEGPVMLKLELQHGQSIIITYGGSSVTATYNKLGSNSSLTISGKQYRLGDVFQVGSKNIQISGFGSVLLNEISNGTSGSGDPAIVTCTGKNYYLNNDIVNTCMLKPSSDSINAGKWKINCSTKKLSVADFPKKVLYGKEYIDREKCTWFGNNTYFDKLYISKGAEELIFDVDTHKIVESTANIAKSKGIKIATQNKAYYCPFWKRDYALTPTSKYTEITISGVCKLIIRSDVATDDRSGIIVNNLADVPEKLFGAMVREEDMKEIGELKC